MNSMAVRRLLPGIRTVRCSIASQSACVQKQASWDNFSNITLSNNLVVSNFGCSQTRFYSDGATRDVKEEITKLVGEDKVVIFMKGVPEAPRCGFSNAVVQIMRMHDVKFQAHNVLEDEGLRQGIKDFSNWPTIPQVYFNGEFIGGCDILLQMHQSGELVEELTKIGIKSALLSAEEDKKE